MNTSTRELDKLIEDDYTKELMDWLSENARILLDSKEIIGLVGGCSRQCIQLKTPAVMLKSICSKLDIDDYLEAPREVNKLKERILELEHALKMKTMELEHQLKLEEIRNQYR